MSKRIAKNMTGLDRSKFYSLNEAVKLIKKRANAKFNETIELAMNLGVDPRHSDQMVRGVCALPNGSGRTVRVGVFAKGAKDLDILRRAHRAMHKHLASEWERRAPGVPYANAYQALIMASIVEKETGQAKERPQIAGVFINRLRRGMLLQTDPTIIYGLGVSFDGNLRKRDLTTDGPYNTYTRAGLPPTPIALPGLAAIQAALKPARTDALYFVAKGDGTHEFSPNLEAHNRAVNKYQRRGG